MNQIEKKALHIMANCIKGEELSKKNKKIIKKTYKKTAGSYIGVLAEREEIKKRIDQVASEGKIGIDWFATDCDHSHSKGVSIIPASVIAFIRWEEIFWSEAEGRQGCKIIAPIKRETETRDLALEAFENGHPHLVSSRF